MRKLIPIILSFALTAVSGPSSRAGIMEDESLTLPSSLDLASEERTLSLALPSMTTNPSVAKRDGIEQYRRDLERFNQIYLQGYLERIGRICDRLKQIEGRVNELGRNDEIRKSERDEILRQIAMERENCLTQNAATSPYFEIYYRFLNYYRSAMSAADGDLNRCMSQNSCRNRER